MATFTGLGGRFPVDWVATFTGIRSLPLLGMQAFDKSNTVSIKKADVSIAKNYLN